jgi:hypothetical protein
LILAADQEVESGMVPSRGAHDPAQTERVLGLLDQLIGNGTTRVEAIDDEFYWRCCRLDFVAAVEPLRQRYRRACETLQAKCERARGLLRAARSSSPLQLLSPPLAPVADSRLGDVTPHALIAALSEEFGRIFRTGADEPIQISPELTTAMDVYCDALAAYVELMPEIMPRFDFEPEDFDSSENEPGSLPPIARQTLEVSRAYGLPYSTVLLHVTMGAPVSLLYDCRVECSNPDDRDTFDLVQLDVYSAGLTGEWVASFLHAYCSVTERRFPRPSPARDDAIQVRFDLKTDLVSNVPFLRVTVGLPLPPQDVLSRAYDAVVCERHRWDKLLLQAANRQRPETALRTWAVGLLIGAGWDTNEAIRVVTERAGWDRYVSQERFNQDRRLLVERMPAARDHLFRRG